MPQDTNIYNLTSQYWRDDLDSRPVMVSIRCTAYNQEKYIRDALEGFVNQQTNFRFEAIVHDDASTDGTAKIISEYAEKYPSIIKPIYETENLYSKWDGSLTRLLDDHMRGKYIAFCEGDDYWIDPQKLQKQVDFLESHPDYVLVCTDYIKMNISNGIERIRDDVKDEEITIPNLLKRNLIGTLTVLIKSEVLFDCNKIQKPKWPLGDWPFWLYAAKIGKIKRLPYVTSKYRILPESASHFSNKDKEFDFRMASFEIPIFFCKLYNKNSFRYFLKRFLFIIKFTIKNRQQLSNLKYLFIKNYKV